MSIYRSISLIGMMSSGKTILGKYLANALGVNFFDTDKEIEKKEKRDISEIFSKESELYFRNLETKVISSLVNGLVFPVVISLGGGSFSNKELQELLLAKTLVIYINVELDVLIKRLEKSNLKKRPLLANVENISDFVTNIYNERKADYEKAHFIFDNSNNNPQTSLKKLLSFIKDKGINL